MQNPPALVLQLKKSKTPFATLVRFAADENCGDEGSCVAVLPMSSWLGIHATRGSGRATGDVDCPTTTDKCTGAIVSVTIVCGPFEGTGLWLRRNWNSHGIVTTGAIPAATCGKRARILWCPSTTVHLTITLSIRIRSAKMLPYRWCNRRTPSWFVPPHSQRMRVRPFEIPDVLALCLPQYSHLYQVCPTKSEPGDGFAPCITPEDIADGSCTANME
jgi:hypothetical protein